jgi:lipopolysaccharide/colanic/teichoic acid biosynthesis glycosyltransferase
MIDMDIYYAQNKSLALDLKILCRTIPAVLSQTKELKDEIKPVADGACPERR